MVILRLHRLFCVDSSQRIIVRRIGKVTSATYKAFAYSVAKSTSMKMFKEECIAFAFLDMGIAALQRHFGVFYQVRYDHCGASVSPGSNERVHRDYSCASLHPPPWVIRSSYRCRIAVSCRHSRTALCPDSFSLASIGTIDDVCIYRTIS
jgi:hypothetical protein